MLPISQSLLTQKALYIGITLFGLFALIGLFIRIFLRLLLRHYVHHFSVGSISWNFGLKDVEWEGKTVTVLSEQRAIERTRVHVDSISLGIARHHANVPCLALKCQGVCIQMPKSHFARRLQTNKAAGTPHKTSPPDRVSSDHHLPKVGKALWGIPFRIMRFIIYSLWAMLPKSVHRGFHQARVRYKTKIEPALKRQLTRVGNFLLNFARFKIQIKEIDIRVESVCRAQLSAFAGLELVTSHDRSRIYAGLSKLVLSDLTQAEPVSVLEMPDTLLLDTSASIFASDCPSLASLSKSDVKPRNVDMFLSIVSKASQANPISVSPVAVRTFIGNLRASIPTPKPEDMLSNENKEPSQTSEGKAQRQDPILCLRKLAVNVPAVQFRHTASKDLQLYVTVDSIFAQADLHKEDAIPSELDKYKYWTGKESHKLAFTLKAGWKAWRAEINTLNSKPSRIAEVAELKIFATSSWTPAALKQLHKNAHSTSFNDDLIISEVILDGFTANMTFEQMKQAQSIVDARARALAQIPVAPLGPSKPKSKSFHLPRMILGLDTAHGELQISGPRDSETSWTSRDKLCFTVPPLSVRVDTSYSSLSLHRTDHQRRQARRAVASGRMHAPESLASPLLSTAATNEYLAVSGDESGYASSNESGPQRNPYDTREAAFFTPGNASFRQPEEHMYVDIAHHSYLYKARITLNMSEPILVSLLCTEVDHNMFKHSISSVMAGNNVSLSRYTIFKLGPADTQAAITVPAFEDGAKLDWTARGADVSCVMEELSLELCHVRPLDCLQGVLSAFPVQSASDQSTKPRLPVAEKLPQDTLFTIAVNKFRVFVASEDIHHPDGQSRGLSLLGQCLHLHVFATAKSRSNFLPFSSRSKLDLDSDIRLQAFSLLAQDPEGADKKGKMTKTPPVLLIKTGLKHLKLDPFFEDKMTSLDVTPVDSAVSSRNVSRSMKARRKVDAPQTLDGSIGAEESAVLSPSVSDWELKGRGYFEEFQKPQLFGRGRSFDREFFSIPNVTVRCTVTMDGNKQERLQVAITSARISSNLSVYHIYCSLMAIQTCRVYLKRPSIATHNTSPSEHSRRPLAVRFECPDLFAKLVLPHDFSLFFHIRRSVASFDSQTSTSTVSFDSLSSAVPSPLARNTWENVMQFYAWKIITTPQPHLKIAITGDTGRIRIPFKFYLSHIIDNAATMAKAVKQIVWQTVKGHMSSCLEPRPEGAKRLPDINLQLRLLIFEAQDDPFETNLNMIRRAGRSEQLARMERDALFDEKVRQMTHSGDVHSHEFSTAEERAAIVQQAHERLKAYNASSWVKRINNATQNQSRREETVARRLVGRAKRLQDVDYPINLVEDDQKVPLMRATFAQVDLRISRPEFADSMTGIRQFLKDTGNLPESTQFTLLVPLHLDWKMAEAKVTLRDYPLPFIHVPPSQTTTPAYDYASQVGEQSSEASASWHLQTDWVIGEDFPEPASIRRVACEIVPKDMSSSYHPAYVILVPRSAMPTKMYALPRITVSSQWPTIFTWGQSYQPCISDIARVFDGLSKPPPDPSERVGFWDKVRLKFHGAIKIRFGRNGDVHLYLKGSRDPYSLEGVSAGFVMCWRGSVGINIGVPNKDRELVQVLSDQYLLSVPNLDRYKDAAATGILNNTNHSRGAKEKSNRHTIPSPWSANQGSAEKRGSSFLKVMASLVGGVRWGMGFRFERTCTPDTCTRQPPCNVKSTFHRPCKIFDFIPHYMVKTRTVEGAFDEHGKQIDSYDGFRSHFIHWSLSLCAPTAGQLSGSAQEAKNSFHFSPMLMHHFFRWWQLFDSAMSLPIRQGQLFPSAQEASKKFGRHTATIKYRFDFSPLYLCHTYRQEDWVEFSKGITSVLGIKGRIEDLKIDLHQRAEEFTLRRPEFQEPKTVVHKKFYLAEVHCERVDARAIRAIFQDPEKAKVPLDEDLPESHLDEIEKDAFLSDEQLQWVDYDDFVDLGPQLRDENPKVQMYNVLRCPIITFYRQPKIDDVAVLPSGDAKASSNAQHDKTSKFGSEKTHTCLIGCAPEPLDIQKNLALERLKELQKRFDAADPDELLPLRPGDSTRRKRKEELARRILAVKKVFNRLVKIYEYAKFAPTAPSKGPNETELSSDNDSQGPRSAFYSMDDNSEDVEDDVQIPLTSKRIFQEMPKWTNRVMMHSPEIKIDNDARDILFAYYYATRERKAMAYQITARAVQFINDLARQHEQERHRHRAKSTVKDHDIEASASADGKKLLEQLLSPGPNPATDWASVSTSNQGTSTEERDFQDPAQDAAADLPEAFKLNNSFLAVLIRPQFHLKSDLEDSSQVVVSTLVGIMRTFTVEDTTMKDDPVNSTVLHRSYCELKGVQAFWPRPLPTQLAKEHRDINEFVPLEVLLDNTVDPYNFDRIVPATKAMFRIDKFNRLRISSQAGQGASVKHQHTENGCKECNSERLRKGIDEMAVAVGKLSVSADPVHYGAVYNVVTNLVLYSNPSRRKRSERLEAALLLNDFNDLRKRAEVVAAHQIRMRTMLAMLAIHQQALDSLEPEKLQNFFLLQYEYLKEAEYLELEIAAIRQAQFKREGSTEKSNSGHRIKAIAHEVVWHMLNQDFVPFVKIGVRGVNFDWWSRSDSSTSNALVIQDMQALNCAADHLFPEIIAKYQGTKDMEHALEDPNIFLIVIWTVLPAVGGIQIIENFEMHLHPISLQLERRVGDDMIDYIFSQRKNNSVHDHKRHVSNNPPATSPKTVEHSRQPAIYVSSSNRSTESLQSVSTTSTSHRTSGLSMTRPSSSSASSLQIARNAASPLSSSSSLYPNNGRVRSLRGVRSMESLGVGSRSVAEFSAVNGGSSSSFASSPDLSGEEGELDLAPHDADHLDVQEMKNRAKANHTFIAVKISPTVICLSYKSLSKSSLTDVYGLLFKTPTFVYRSQTWSYLDLLNAAKKDITSSIISQSGSLLSQVLTTARNPKNFAKHHPKLQERLSKPRKLLRFNKSQSSSISDNEDSDEARKLPNSPLRKSLDRNDSSITHLVKVDTKMHDDPIHPSDVSVEHAPSRKSVSGSDSSSPNLERSRFTTAGGNTILEAEAAWKDNGSDDEFDFSSVMRPQDEKKWARHEKLKSPPRGRGKESTIGQNLATDPFAELRSSSPQGHHSRQSGSGTYTTLSHSQRKESLIEREFNHLLQHFAPKRHRFGRNSVGPSDEGAEGSRSPTRGREGKERL